MKELIERVDFFELIALEFDPECTDILSDVPIFPIENDDGTSSYLEDYEDYLRSFCPTANNEVHLFTEIIHVQYNPNNKEIVLCAMDTFNSTEAGIAREYAKLYLIDTGEYCKLTIKENSFIFNNKEYKLGTTEEENFQISCTDMGYFNNVVNEVKKFILQDIDKNGLPEYNK